jgi:hypothetical protein
LLRICEIIQLTAFQRNSTCERILLDVGIIGNPPEMVKMPVRGDRVISGIPVGKTWKYAGTGIRGLIKAGKKGPYSY